MAETWVFRKRDGLRFKSWAAPEAEIVTANLDLTAKNALELSGNSALQAGMGNQERNPEVGEPEGDE